MTYESVKRLTGKNGSYPVRLVAFDLDGTLLHGDTVCEAIARRLGKFNRMQELERHVKPEDIKAARQEMAEWYAPFTMSEICSYLTSVQLAQGVEEGFSLLKQHGIKIAIISITWEFAVEYFAKRLGASYHIGTQLSPDARIVHFWPHDKSRWLTQLMKQLGFTRREVAAVGNSNDDISMLRAAGHSFFVGRQKPDRLDGTRHFPDGNILQISEAIVSIGRKPETADIVNTP